MSNTEGTHVDVQHCLALALHRELPHCTFPPEPLRSVGTFLWDSTLATPQVLGDERREDRSQQWKAFRAIPGCRTFGRGLCRPCRLEKSSHLFQDKIQRCCHVSGFLNCIWTKTSGKISHWICLDEAFHQWLPKIKYDSTDALQLLGLEAWNPSSVGEFLETLWTACVQPWSNPATTANTDKWWWLKQACKVCEV